MCPLVLCCRSPNLWVRKSTSRPTSRQSNPMIRMMTQNSFPPCLTPTTPRQLMMILSSSWDEGRPESHFGRTVNFHKVCGMAPSVDIQIASRVRFYLTSCCVNSFFLDFLLTNLHEWIPSVPYPDLILGTYLTYLLSLSPRSQGRGCYFFFD